MNALVALISKKVSMQGTAYCIEHQYCDSHFRGNPARGLATSLHVVFLRVSGFPRRSRKVVKALPTAVLVAERQRQKPGDKYKIKGKAWE